MVKVFALSSPVMRKGLHVPGSPPTAEADGLDGGATVGEGDGGATVGEGDGGATVGEGGATVDEGDGVVTGTVVDEGMVVGYAVMTSLHAASSSAATARAAARETGLAAR
jgi:hypothetical protein